MKAISRLTKPGPNFDNFAPMTVVTSKDVGIERLDMLNLGLLLLIEMNVVYKSWSKFKCWNSKLH